MHNISCGRSQCCKTYSIAARNLIIACKINSGKRGGREEGGSGGGLLSNRIYDNYVQLTH